MDFPGWSRQYGRQGVRLLAVPALDFVRNGHMDGRVHSRMAVMRALGRLEQRAGALVDVRARRTAVAVQEEPLDDGIYAWRQPAADDRPVVGGRLHLGETSRQLDLAAGAGQELRRAAREGEVDPDRRRRAVHRGAQRVQDPPVR